MLWIMATIVVLAVIGIGVFLHRPMFGGKFEGERLARMEKSPQYRDGKFHNRTPRAPMGGNNSFFKTFRELILDRTVDRTPSSPIPTIKTDLRQLPLDSNLLVWMGHSALYMHIDGKRLVVDPTLASASPVAFFNKPFAGSDAYRPQDIPDLDYFLITHDHWDHLDYYTVKEISDRVAHFICPLGVGAHLEHWGVPEEKITELDWDQSQEIADQFTITALPARHFSGRGLTRDPTLWASYFIDSPSGTIFLSADTGYDTHFQEIKEKVGTIDLAIMENGQYNKNWHDIHLMPGDLIKAINELDPKRVMTVHHAKYALARHPWYEPLDTIWEAAQEHGFSLLTPMIGEPVRWTDPTQTFPPWWKESR